MKKLLYTSLLATFLLLAGLGCKRNDPCANTRPFKADFDIKEVVYDTTFVTDTTLVENFVVFEAKEKYETYQWTIGEDERTFNTKAVRLYFANPTPLLTIRLIAYKKPNNSCFPNDDGIDTVIKTLKVMPKGSSRLLGDFEGVSIERPNDRYTVQVLFGNYYNDNDPFYVLENWIKGCSQKLPPSTAIYEYHTDNIYFGYRNAIIRRVGRVGCLCEGTASISSNNDTLYIKGIDNISFDFSDPRNIKKLSNPNNFRGVRKK